MLVNFRFKNCRSFYDEALLSMQATSDKTYCELNTFKAGGVIPNGKSELLKSAVIFGGNASGKSNVLKAFSYMVNFVLLSSAQFPIVNINEPFAFKVGADIEESLYEVEIIQNRTFYKYGFALCKGAVKREWLYKREKRLTRVFERDNGKLKIIGESSQTLGFIRIPDTSLLLSIGRNYNLSANNCLEDVINWFKNINVVLGTTANPLNYYSKENGKYRAQAMEILKKADIGITDIEVIKEKKSGLDVDSITLFDKIKGSSSYGQNNEDNEWLNEIDLKTRFDVFDGSDTVVGYKDVLLYKDYGFNSEGTTRLLCYLGWILEALDKGLVLFIDEIDSQLHFLVADYIVQLFNSIENNPKNAQLICTAHNVMLMDEGLRRDQIYFTSKDKRGHSTIVSLADYNGVRSEDLFSKRYLAGFYADLPNMSEDKE